MVEVENIVTKKQTGCAVLTFEEVKQKIKNYLILNWFLTFSSSHVAKELKLDLQICYTALESLSCSQDISKIIKTTLEKKNNVTFYRFYPFALAGGRPLVNEADLRIMILKLLERGENHSEGIYIFARDFFQGVRRNMVFDTLKKMTENGEISYVRGRCNSKCYTCAPK